MKVMTINGPATAAKYPGNDAALQAAYAKRPNVTAPMAPRQPTPGSELARRELMAMAAKHQGCKP